MGAKPKTINRVDFDDNYVMIINGQPHTNPPKLSCIG